MQRWRGKETAQTWRFIKHVSEGASFTQAFQLNLQIPQGFLALMVTLAKLYFKDSLTRSLTTRRMTEIYTLVLSDLAKMPSKCHKQVKNSCEFTKCGNTTLKD